MTDIKSHQESKEEQKEKPEAFQGVRLPVRGDKEEKSLGGIRAVPSATAASDATEQEAEHLKVQRLLDRTLCTPCEVSTGTDAAALQCP